MIDACAAIVERDDPNLHATALFAAKPARSRLMVLYAFDCELSRAVRASKESLIPRMRLQWWRDMLCEAGEGKPPKAHEVAAPLAKLIHQGMLDPVDLDKMAQARGYELSRPLSDEDFAAWQTLRFDSLFRSAIRVLIPANTPQASRSHAFACQAISAAYVIRNAHRMAHSGEAPMLHSMVGADWASLARAELTSRLREQFKILADAGIDELQSLRGAAAYENKSAIPAFLPLMWTERCLRTALRSDFDLGQLDSIDRPFDGLKLAWRAFRGRW